MSWQLALVVYLILSTASYIYRRKLAVSFPAQNQLINAIFFLAALYPIGLITAVFTPHNLHIGWLNFIILLIGGVGFSSTSILAFKANRSLDAGLYTILTNLTPVVTIVSAWILLNNGLTTNQLAGAIIILVSAFMVSTPLWHHHRRNKSAGLIAAFLTILITGLAITFERWMLSRVDFGAYLIVGWGGQVLWMLVFAWPVRHQLTKIRDRGFRNSALIFSYVNALKGLAWISAVKLSGNVSLISAFSGFATVMVVLAAYRYLNEKNALWFKLLAATVGIIGIAIINY